MGYLNDLWRFDGTSWTWIAGNTIISAATFGTLGIPNTSNLPGGRYGAVSWIDQSNNFMLFGGNGFAEGSGGNIKNYET